MSAAATLFISVPRALPRFKLTGKGAFLFTGNGGLKLSLNHLLFGIPCRSKKRNFSFTSVRPISPVMEWQDCTYNLLGLAAIFVEKRGDFRIRSTKKGWIWGTGSPPTEITSHAVYGTSFFFLRVKLEVDVPCSVAYDCYSDRESIPRWMPFISSVKILEDKPDHSRWSLKYTAFGQDLEFSWLARNMQPIPNQKIHWRSLEGLPNKGAVRFYPKGPSSCIIDLTVSYEIPQILTPFASALRPLLERLLLIGLRRFAKFAEESQEKSPKA